MTIFSPQITRRLLLFASALLLTLIGADFVAQAHAAETTKLCQINVVDQESKWPVPLIELTTNHHVQFVTDNAGVIAFDLPELMGQETWF